MEIKNKEAISGIIAFACMNEIFNYLLLLYLAKKLLVSKASLYGILSAIYILVYGFFHELHTIEYFESIIFVAGYAIIFLEKKKEK